MQGVCETLFPSCSVSINIRKRNGRLPAPRPALPRGCTCGLGLHRRSELQPQRGLFELLLRLRPALGGESCSTLTYRAAPRQNGYGRNPNITTWGGGAIFDPATRKYHLYVSRIAHGCVGLATWGYNSQIDHAVADNVTGPYAFHDVAVPAQAHNAAPLALPDGTFAIFHIGDGTTKTFQNCSDHPAAAAVDGDDQGLRIDDYELETGPRTGATNAGLVHGLIHVSSSLEGPWTPLVNNTLGFCDNPAPWVHPSNGTLFIICGERFLRASSIEGPWTVVGTIPRKRPVPGGTSME